MNLTLSILSARPRYSRVVSLIIVAVLMSGTAMSQSKKVSRKGTTTTTTKSGGANKFNNSKLPSGKVNGNGGKPGTQTNVPKNISSVKGGGTDVKTTTNINGAKRTVLYTMEPNEQFYYNEYSSNMKIAGNKFAAVTFNPQTKKMTLVINGKKIKTAGDVWASIINLDTNELMYSYNQGDEYFVNVNGTVEGPYEWVSMDSYGSPYRYTFSRMGRVYRHDDNGAVYEASDMNTWSSHNGRHKLVFSNDYQRISLDGRTLTLPIKLDPSDPGIETVLITDDGVALLWLYDDDNSVGCIIDSDSLDMVDYEEFAHRFSNLIKRYNLSLFKNGFDRETFEGNEFTGEDLTFSIPNQDKTHWFTSAWNYDYVMVDNKKIPCAPPVCAFYDKNANCFAWATQEGRNIVLYTYQL